MTRPSKAKIIGLGRAMKHVFCFSIGVRNTVLLVEQFVGSFLLASSIILYHMLHLNHCPNQGRIQGEGGDWGDNNS